MANKDLHPTIRDFKTFVKKHPGLIKEVKRKGERWQPYYEKWILLGEDDPSWNKYKDEDNGKTNNGNHSKSKKDKKQQEVISQVMKFVENVDLNKVENHINQLNGAITNIQSLIGQFREAKNHFPTQNNNKPFPMNKD